MDAQRGVEAFNRAVVSALEEIRRRQGLKSEAAFVRALQEHVGDGISASAYNRWVTGHVKEVPGWPLVAAAQAFGHSLDELLGTPPDSRIGRLETELAAVQLDLTNVMENQNKLIGQVDELHSVVGELSRRQGQKGPPR